MIKSTDSSAGLAIDARGVESLKQSAKQKSPEALREAAKQFEALFMNNMLKSMRQATPQDGLMDNDQSRMYTSMLDQQLSQKLASRGVGLADMLVRQLSTSMANQVPPTDTGNIDSLQKSLDIDVQQALQKKSAQQADLNSAAAASSSARTTRGSGPAHVQAFRERLAAHAEEASQSTGIPAKFMLGQAALESGWGKKEIRTADGGTSHNLFGIKAGPGWKGRVVEAVTTEYVGGVAHKRVEKFRAYDNYADCFRDYAKLLRSNPRYENVLASASDVNGFAHGLQRAGYATDPHYATKLTQIINRHLS